MKLSIVILCWNDYKVIRDCLDSIYSSIRATDFEVLVSDNGSSDGTRVDDRVRIQNQNVVSGGVPNTDVVPF